MRLRLFFADSPALVLVNLSSMLLASWFAASPSPSFAAGRTCATIEPSAVEAQAIEQHLRQNLEQRLGGETIQSSVSGVVQIAFHVIHNGVDGNLTDDQIKAQIAELNLDYSGADGGYDTGYRFVLTSVDRTLNPAWFDLIMGSNDEKRMKETLGIDPVHHINIYTARIQALGWSTFPWGIDESDIHHGIVIHYGSVPGGYIQNFNLGRTATHEIGHYLGLFHTFFTGCQEPNDYVADTPAQAAQTTGCPSDGTDTCALPGPDPIHNYLDYSDDPCYAEFTPGQDDRMDGMTTTYRPHLINQPLAVGDLPHARVAALRPVFPNPSGHRVRLSFAIRQEAWVSLRVHDLAGRVVARLVEGELPPGDYDRSFEAQSGSGVYFAELTAAGERVSRRLVVTR